MTTPTVAVLTTTIGRPSLEEAIQSIQQQSYPCKHYVFVDGKQHWDKVQEMITRYPDVTFSLLGMNTGGNGITNGVINAIAPLLVHEDIFCFLDDDNWHDSDHVEKLATFLHTHQLNYAYSLRRIYAETGNYLCDDNFESLGFWQQSTPTTSQHNGKSLTITNNRLIDTNCYAITREASLHLMNAWKTPKVNDRAVFDTLLHLGARGGCTGQRTTNYLWDIKGLDLTQEEFETLFSQFHTDDDSLPWLTPTLLIDGQLIPVNSDNPEKLATNTVTG